MRDFRNAKAMARTLKEDLAQRSFPIGHSDSLELVARLLGCKNWQTLAAAIEAGESQPAASPAATPAPAAGTLLPVIPMRDLVVLPEMVIPLFAGRPKTLRAIERAMTGDRRLFIVTQRRGADDDPAADGLFEVGVIAQILQTHRLPDGSMKVMVQAERRARLVRLHDGELLEADIEPIETPVLDKSGPALAQEALERFGGLANFDPVSPPIAMARMTYMTAYPGQFADLIAPHVATRLDQAQELLETPDPAERLQKLMALMSEGRKAA
ncbi:MAG TPA: LON peptidase substrate-binding domain-containing protein [Caulobacteraceae bacterium]